jgi:hypothetical protein
MALILVMLALLVLSTLAASMIISARSETLASYNYKLNTQADYLAKAGIQQAVNWFRSGRYQPVLSSQSATYYSVTSDGSVFSLYTSDTAPVRCISSCSSVNSTVQLIGYGSGSSNYPSINDAGGTAVAAAFASDLVNVRVTGDASNSGTFSVNATLLNYQTVNPNIATCPSPAGGAPPCPVETWLITSLGSWTGGSGQTGAVATAEEQAIIQPIYTPTWGNAIYGYCSVSMTGSAGVCTDAFNSAFGQYGGGNKSVAAGACGSNTNNVIDSGAGVGANGSVTLGSNVTVAGNVTIGTGAPSTCGTGFNGSASSVLGEVVNGPYKAPPAVPTFRTGFPGAAPSYGSSQGLPLNLKAGTWPTFPSSTYTTTAGASVSTIPPLASGGPWMDSTCNGTQAHPFEINSISISGNGTTVQLIGGPDAAHPVYYDIDSISESGQSEIDVSGFVVLNVQSSMSIYGNGVTNGISGVVDIPPAAVQINYAGTSGVSIGGNGAISALVNAPNADVTLGGGGSKGYFVGAIQANTVDDHGGYPVHYDLQLNRLGGSVGTMAISSYSRTEM